MVRTTWDNEYERKLLENVERVGWQATNVLGDEEGPGFAYSIGFPHSFGVPEILIVGLDSSRAYDLLRTVAEAAASDPGLDVPSLSAVHVDGHPCRFLPVPRTRYADFVLSAIWFHEGSEFDLLQLVWPDAEGRFPWHGEVRPEVRRVQPVLGEVAQDGG